MFSKNLFKKILNSVVGHEPGHQFFSSFFDFFEVLMTHSLWSSVNIIKNEIFREWAKKIGDPGHNPQH